ncbi:hypothetical protein ACH3XW_10760 [Acanthocheilonema viteae]
MIRCCGHTFHYQCILHWIRVFGECPACYAKSQEVHIIKQLFFITGGRSRQQGWTSYLSLPEQMHRESVREQRYLLELQRDKAIFSMQIEEAIKAIYEVMELRRRKAMCIIETNKRQLI